MSVWDEVDRMAKKSEEEFLGTQARLEAIGFIHMSVSPYGVWRAKHKLVGWLTANTGEELLKLATQALVRA